MSPMLRSMLVLAVAASFTGCSTVTDTVDDWMGSGKPDRSAPAELRAFKAEVAPLELWDRSVGSGTDGLVVKLHHQILENRLYAAEVDGEITATALPSGESVWSIALDERIMSGVSVDHENVYIGSESGRLIALDRKSGTERWSANLLSEILAPVATTEQQRVVVRTADGKVRALNSRDGVELWSYEREVPVLTLRGTSSPVVSGGKVFAGLDSGEVVALSLDDGRELWIKSVTSPRGRTEIERMVDIDASPVVVGDTLYVVGYQGNLAALHVESGELLWKRQLSSLMTPEIQAKYLFVADQAGAIWAFDRHEGSALWRQEGLKNRAPTSPLADGRHIVVGDSEGYLHWLAVEDGRFVGRIQLDKSGFSAPVLDYGEGVVSYAKSGRLSLITP